MQKNENQGWGVAMVNRVKEGLAEKMTSEQRQPGQNPRQSVPGVLKA